MKHTLHKQKEKIQSEAFNAWLKSGYKGTIEAATGTGKNFISFLAIQACDLEDERPILVLAEATDRERTYFEDLEKFESIYSVDIRTTHTIEFACYQSAYKWEKKDYKLVIADEFHDSLTLKYSRFYYNNNYSWIMGLSATVDRYSKIDPEDDFSATKGELLDEIAPVCYVYDMDKARKEEVLPPLNVYVVNHKLDDLKKTIDGGTKAKPFKTTEFRHYTYLESKLRTARYIKNSKSRDFTYSMFTRKRADFLYNLPSKVIEAKKLKEFLEKNEYRTLFFANSLKQLHDIVPGAVIASKDAEGNTQKKDVNDKIMDRFQNNDIQTVGSFKKLKQGANLNDLDVVCLLSYYSKDKDYIQRVGRLRFRKNFIATVIIFRTIGTKEDSWFKKMTEKFDMNNALYFDNVDHFTSFMANKKGITMPQFT